MLEQAVPNWTNYYRIVASKFPPINFFEDLVGPELMEALFYIEGLTNDRLRDEVGEISLVAAEDRICGPGSSPIMAAFTHIGLASRFTDGSYGAYYAAESLETAIAETKFHRERFLQATAEPAGEVDMRSYIGNVIKPMYDIRKSHPELHAPDPHTYPQTQAFSKQLKQCNAWGILYRSVRRQGGECIAALRPPAISIPTQGPHLGYVWDGKRISHIYEKRFLSFAT